MTRIFAISHGEMAIETLKSAEMIMGPLEDIIAIPFYSNESREQLMDKIEEELSAEDENDYLFIVDLKGGTPFNVSLLLSNKYNITVVTGLNLPILLEAITIAESTGCMGELADSIVQVGKTSIDKVKINKNYIK